MSGSHLQTSAVTPKSLEGHSAEATHHPQNTQRPGSALLTLSEGTGRAEFQNSKVTDTQIEFKGAKFRNGTESFRDMFNFAGAG